MRNVVTALAVALILAMFGCWFIAVWAATNRDQWMNTGFLVMVLALPVGGVALWLWEERK